VDLRGIEKSDAEGGLVAQNQGEFCSAQNRRRHAATVPPRSQANAFRMLAFYGHQAVAMPPANPINVPIIISAGLCLLR